MDHRKQTFGPGLVRIVFLAPLVFWATCAGSLAWGQDEIDLTIQKKDPAVEAVLATKPATPVELVRAAKILADLGRADLAKPFLAKVLAAQLDAKQLVALHGEFGSPVFIKMASREDLGPEARQLTDAVLDAVAAELSDPKQLAALVARLQDPDPDIRYTAMDKLRQARGASVAPLMAVLGDPKRKTEHANVRAAVVHLGSDAIGPLLGVLDSPEPRLQIETIRILAQMEAQPASLYLLAPALAEESPAEVRVTAAAALIQLLGSLPSPREAAALLARRAKSYLDAKESLATDDEDQVEIWTWDPAQKQAVGKRYSRDHAYRMHAARLACDARAVAPADESIWLLDWSAQLELAAHEARVAELDDSGTPVAAIDPDESIDRDTRSLESLLVYAMDSGYSGAVAGAARLLGDQGPDALPLFYGRTQPSPLVRATRHADRRVRFAAVEAIMKLGPTEPYPGSSHLVDAIGFLAATSGTRRAIVAGPITQESVRVAGYLAAVGYEVDTASTGKGLVRLAIRSPDYELALVDASLEDPVPNLLIQQLRHDGRTAALPVGIVARADQQSRARHMANIDPLARAFPRPHVQEAVDAMVEGLLGLSGPLALAHDQRQKQAAGALGWLADLSAWDRTIYDLHRIEDAVLTPLYVPELGPATAVVLGNLGTAKSQQALVDLASRWTQPLELRQAAMESLRDSIEEHGIQLTARQILLQYERYNQSATLDTDTQRVLASILDAIEASSGTVEEGSQ